MAHIQRGRQVGIVVTSVNRSWERSVAIFIVSARHAASTEMLLSSSKRSLTQIKTMLGALGMIAQRPAGILERDECANVES